ncbi:hypothetical protein T4E_10169 [Trichinella pseudospiralis]|uniref:Uncharacterized protein n=1 Tax=Trichinella pseudospiralis TaxID=6337 RepID=A0A0V0XHQ4_TRIPS|nr:hypothetical protein T4E_10169 [Trichinella pseudospiralis]
MNVENGFNDSFNRQFPFCVLQNIVYQKINKTVKVTCDDNLELCKVPKSATLPLRRKRKLLSKPSDIGSIICQDDILQ